MNAITSALRELLGLFVDDWQTSAAVVMWLAVAAFVLPLVMPHGDLRGVALFAGFAGVLVGSVLLAAARPKP